MAKIEGRAAFFGFRIARTRLCAAATSLADAANRRNRFFRAHLNRIQAANWAVAWGERRGCSMHPGRTQIAWLVALGAALWLGACGASQAASEPDAPSETPERDKIAIYVTSNGWHSEIVIARAQLSTSAIPEATDFPDAPYLSFGWGDETYYPEPDPTVEMALRAALVPTPAVVHMSGLRAHPSNVFPADEVVEVKLTQVEFQRLVTYLDASFARRFSRRRAPGGAGPIPFQPLLSGNRPVPPVQHMQYLDGAGAQSRRITDPGLRHRAG